LYVFFIYPEAHEEDFIPYVETSLKVKSISFGAKGSLLLNFDGNIYDPATEFAEGRHLVFAQDVNNDAQALFGYERMSNRFFTNKVVHKGNLFARANMSQERLLKYNKTFVEGFVTTVPVANKIAAACATTKAAAVCDVVPASAVV